MRVAIGLDHAGFHIRDLVLEHVVTLGHEVIDEGADHYDAKDDFPDFLYDQRILASGLQT